MRAFAAALLVAAAPAIALAQQTPPPSSPPAPQPSPARPVLVDRAVSGFVVDARAVLGKFGQRPLTAEALGVPVADMPGPGIGGTFGAHLYPLRFRSIAVGVGGEIMLTARSRQPLDAAGEPAGPRLKARAFSLSPQVSLNFGHHNGWSFVSAGLGTASFETWAETGDMPGRRVRGINYGGGARWFWSPHLAFSVDLRFYAMSPGPADAGLAARPRQRLMMISAGISAR